MYPNFKILAWRERTLLFESYITHADSSYMLRRRVMSALGGHGS